MSRKPWWQRDQIWAAISGLAALLVYTLTLAPTVLFADGGEFQFVPWLPGIAHPTGYPLYVMLGWGFSHLLPIGEVAWRLNWFSALNGAVAVSVTYLVVRQLLARMWPNAAQSAAGIIAGMMAALTFAFSQTVWSQAIIAEVYSLHALFIAVLLWLSLRIPPNAHRNRPHHTLGHNGLWLAAVFGLSLTHHRTTVLLLPAIALYLWLSGYRKPKPAELLRLAGVAILPLALYAYLPLIAPHTPYATLTLTPNQTLTLYDNSLRGFIDHLLANVYGEQVQLTGINPNRLLLSLDFMRLQVGWAGIAIGLIGVWLLRRRPALLALTGVSFVTFLGFNLVYFIGDIYVLFIPNWLLLSLWIGLGWFGAAQWISQTWVNRKRARVTPASLNPGRVTAMEDRLRRSLRLSLAALGLLLPGLLLVNRYPVVDQSANTIARDAWLEILAVDLPEEAVLLSNDRNEMMPLWYYQYVENQQPGWLGLFPLITTNPAYATVGGVLDKALQSERPVYLVKPMDGLSLKADLTPLAPLPHAQLVHAAPPKLNPNHPAKLGFNDQLSLVGYDLAQAGDVITATLYWQPNAALPSHALTSFVHLTSAQDVGVTQSDHQPGGVYYPSSMWQAGEILRDRHTLTLPADLEPGDYTLMTGLYTRFPNNTLQAFGQRQPLTTITLNQIETP